MAIVKLTDTFVRFARSEQFGGILLLVCTVVAMAFANSPFAGEYFAIWEVELGPLSLSHWINDALMAVFFLLIGLELERELYVGELSKIENALLPAFAAVGGMVVPALIHFSLNMGAATERGFGIPMATDIAFALGALAVLGTRIPPALKIFVVAFAVIDDLGAIVLIAIFYTKEMSMGYLAAALVIWIGLILLNRPLRVMSLVPYLLGGAAMWYCLLESGAHASLAGVLLAFAIPFTPRRLGEISPSHRLEHSLHLPVAFLVLPLFALANTGVTVDAAAVALATSANSVGIFMGLLLGKPVGIVLLCLAAVALRVCTLPEGVTWNHIIGAGILGGIGFTMSIYIANLAFEDNEALVRSSKLAVLCASMAAGVAGLLWLFAGTARNPGDPSPAPSTTSS